MTLPTSRAAYEDYYAILDRALADPAGIRIKVDSWETASYHRVRLHTARAIARTESREIYAPGDPQYNVSPHDRLSVLIRGSNERDIWYLLIVPRTFGMMGEIESLSGTEYDLLWKNNEVPDYQPQLISPSGSRLLLAKSDSSSDAPSELSSSTNSTSPEKNTPTPPAMTPSRRL